MALTDAQKGAVQRLLLDELHKRSEEQPYLLVESIIDGTARAKLKALITARQAVLQASHDTIDTKVAESKASFLAQISALEAAKGEIP